MLEKVSALILMLCIISILGYVCCIFYAEPLVPIFLKIAFAPVIVIFVAACPAFRKSFWE